VTLIHGNTGNLFLPSTTLLNSSKVVEEPYPFRGQKWLPATSKYYQSIDYDLKSLKQRGCNLQFHFNNSMDTFLQVLSPFQQYQIAPFTTWDIFNNLRPDYDFNSKIREAKDIVLFMTVKSADFNKYKPPSGYYIYGMHTIPEAVFIPPNEALLILAPNSCK
jgi:hypothetical protein